MVSSSGQEGFVYLRGAFFPGSPLLQLAIEEEQPACAELLLQRGASCKQTFDDGDTPLLCAIQRGAWA